MLVTVKLNHLRIAPRKVRLVAGIMRGKKVSRVLTQLEFLPKKSSLPLRKLLQSAVANAKNDFQLEEADLSIYKIAVDEGPKLKRWRAASRGRGVPIQKKTSHITLVLKGESKEKATAQSDSSKSSKVIKTEKKTTQSQPRSKKEYFSKKLGQEKTSKKFFRRKAF